MRTSPIATAVVALGVLAAPAQAAPGWAGKPPRTSCQEPKLIDGGVPYPREYLTRILKCLDKAWSARFAKAGHRFTAPRVAFYEGPQRTVCGIPWPEGAAAFYCTNRRTLVLP